MYGCESWTVKKAERWRIDAFELWCWRRLLKVSWTARRSSQSILKEISPGCSLEGMMLSWNSSTLATSCKELTHWKRLWCWEGLRQEEKGTTEDEMAGWHYRLDGHEFEWTPGVGDGQGGLTCCDSWGRKELDTTERLNWLWAHLVCIIVCHLEVGSAQNPHFRWLCQCINFPFPVGCLEWPDGQRRGFHISFGLWMSTGLFIQWDHFTYHSYTFSITIEVFSGVFHWTESFAHPNACTVGQGGQCRAVIRSSHKFVFSFIGHATLHFSRRALHRLFSMSKWPASPSSSS